MAFNSIAVDSQFKNDVSPRLSIGRIFELVLVLCTATGVIALVVLLTSIFLDGYEQLSFSFLTNFANPFDASASGIIAPLYGTTVLIIFTFLFAVPMGIFTAIYLEEYSSKSHPLTKVLDVAIANLAGVPSIIYGMLGMALFVRGIGMGNSVLAASLTLALVILPIIIISSREALKAVPGSIRQAAFALGANQFQTIFAHVLPSALPSIVTGIILGLGRAIGETAPLIMVGAAAFLAYLPDTSQGLGELMEEVLLGNFTALPIQIYNWATHPSTEYNDLAATAIIVLLTVLIIMNSIAIAIRYFAQKNK